jgi:putative hemolysin
MCVFADTTECDEWAYYRGKCEPGDSLQPGGAANMPNPASVYCEANGGTLDMRTDAEGGQYGMCVFPDGDECDEWAFFRGECGAGKAVTELAADGWRVYHNAALGYSFDYPADASLDNADEPLHSLTVTGPLSGDDHWPMIFFSHPADREEYRPPEGTDLEAWLVDHRLLPAADQQPAAEVRQPDAQIAGMTAIHTRFERSPQSYAHDKYFFAHAGQLFTVVIVHAGDREDWQVYNHFLESIQFEG